MEHFPSNLLELSVIPKFIKTASSVNETTALLVDDYFTGGIQESENNSTHFVLGKAHTRKILYRNVCGSGIYIYENSLRAGGIDGWIFLKLNRNSLIFPFSFINVSKKIKNL